MKKMVIRKGEVSIDGKGRVVIKNDELKKRVQDFLKSPKATHEGTAGFLDNCDCECKPK